MFASESQHFPIAYAKPDIPDIRGYLCQNADGLILPPKNGIELEELSMLGSDKSKA